MLLRPLGPTFFIGPCYALPGLTALGVSNDTVLKAPGQWLLPGNGSAPGPIDLAGSELRILGSLSNLGRCFQFCPSRQRPSPCSLICQAKTIIASHLSRWVRMRWNRTIQYEGSSVWKCLSSIDAKQRPENSFSPNASTCCDLWLSDRNDQRLRSWDLSS